MTSTFVQAWIAILQDKGPLWPWSYGSWIYNYLCNQCLSSLTLWLRISLWRGVLDTTLCDIFVSNLRQGCGFFCVLQFPPFNKTDRNNITEILLKVALNTITLTPSYKAISWQIQQYFSCWFFRIQLYYFPLQPCKNVDP